MKVLRLLSLALPLVFMFAPPAGYSADIRFITEPTPELDDSGRSYSGVSELTRDLMQRLKLPGDVEVFPWKRAYALMQNEPNVALFPTTRTEAREHDANWVGPILKVSWVFFAKKDANIELNSLEDAKKVGQICGYFGDAKLEFLHKSGFTNTISRYRNRDCIKLLENNRVDLWISSTNAPIMYADTGLFQASEVEIVFTIKEKYLYYAVSKEVPQQTIELLQRTIDTMKREGAFYQHLQGRAPEDMIRAVSVGQEPVLPWLTGSEE
jgi:polar amino acid transport system substrate-binding protein